MNTSAPSAEFIGGFLTASYLIAAVFFWRFWWRNEDRLFLSFAVAFCLMALNYAIPGVHGAPRDAQTGVYLIRLGAFLLIIGAILLKNLPQRSGRRKVRRRW